MTIKVSSLGYIGLSIQDTLEWEKYATKVLGLQTVEQSRTEQSVCFKMDEHPFRLRIEKGDQDKLIYAGWEFANQQDFEGAIKNIEAAGAKVVRGDAAGAEMRFVTEYAASSDPAGNPFEIYYGRTGIVDDFDSPIDVDRFITGDMGMGHLVVPAPNQQETHDFYIQALGFADSDDLNLPPPAEGAPDMRILFMHAANPRHHSLALYNFPVPSGIIHMIFEVPDIDHVGACLDRAKAADIPMMGTLGRHCNDNMLSFYMFGPGGIGIEYGAEGLQIDPDSYVSTVSTEGDIWGHTYEPVS